MGRNLSPILQRELENLDKDANSCKSAMRALKSYVRDLDSAAIPIFLAQVSETKETGSVSGEYTISLYEASSKVVPAIARYGIDPTTPEDKRRHIIHSLCKPLSDSLLGSQESLTSGSALCLKALVECDNWRFASNEMVNKRSRCHINVDDIDIFTTPRKLIHSLHVDDINIFTTLRKLIHSLQDPNIVKSDFSEKQTRRFRSPSSGRFQSCPSPRQNGFQHDLMHEVNGKESLCNNGEQYEGVSESVSSTDSSADGNLQESLEVVPVIKTEILQSSNKISRRNKSSKMLLVLFSILLVVLMALICSDGWDEGDYLVLTRNSFC
ncbi:hypothetical protein SLEP1_g30425 [Rubroshorea leprosula]|uniref:Uncharacterized protein n=1 Tax=Rubroshorea leprosula TaxID=152421 RepID=A0AAV5K8F6_9ROSI|nr:hypothetical protein SLEP1_g30425 [Rubroshorea leprosula]